MTLFKITLILKEPDSGQAYFSAWCGHKLRVTAQASFSPEYITPRHIKIMISINLPSFKLQQIFFFAVQVEAASPNANQELMVIGKHSNVRLARMRANYADGQNKARSAPVAHITKRITL